MFSFPYQMGNTFEWNCVDKYLSYHQNAKLNMQLSADCFKPESSNSKYK